MTTSETLRNSPSIYRYSCFVPFHLTDTASVVFFGHVFGLAHQAFEHFVMHQLECSWTTWFQNPDWIVPLKHAEAEYLNPLQAGQECHMELLVTTLSTSSFTLTNSLHQQKLCCLVRTVHVFCDRLTQQKMPIPPFILSHLSK